MMDSLDEFDIQESFDAMDEEKVGRIDTETFYTLVLALGYAPNIKFKSFVSQWSLVQGHDQNGITLGAAVEFLKKYKRDRRDETLKCFSLVDVDGKGFISKDDIQLLARQAGDEIGVKEAEAIMTHSSSNGSGRISKSAFHALFSPPSP